MDKIAEMIEERLGYTNGWAIDEFAYTDHCKDLAKQIRQQIGREIEEKIYDEYNDYQSDVYVCLIEVREVCQLEEEPVSHFPDDCPIQPGDW